VITINKNGDQQKENRVINVWKNNRAAAENSTQQWFVTAHNPSVLDGLRLRDCEVRLFGVNRNIEGDTVIDAIDLDELILQRPSDEWTLSQMWMNGLLGAISNV
jgi:hypothetical protein